MNALDALKEPSLVAPINEATKEVVEAFIGQPLPVTLAVLFQAWVVLCKLGEIDAGTEFERLIAIYEARKMATHPASATVH